MASVRQIAKDARVSIATVSRVLNNKDGISEDTRQRVLASMNRSRYSPPPVRGQQTNMIGLVHTVENRSGQFGGYDATLLSGATAGAWQQKFDLIVLGLHQDKRLEESYTQYFLRKGLRGVMLRVGPETRHVAEAIAREGFPSIVLAERFDEPTINYIDCASGPESQRAIEYLIHLGHQRIALAIHNRANQDHRDRFQGYRDALEAQGLPYDPGLVLPIISDLTGGASVIDQVQAMPEPPTAIYFTNPLSTLGGLRRAHELGLRIPEDLSIVGFDDSEVRHMAYPVFTAVCQDAEQVGRDAAQWLTRVVEGEGPATMRRVLPAVFEVNRTTAAPPARRTNES